jgi:hypothetical protein
VLCQQSCSCILANALRASTRQAFLGCSCHLGWLQCACKGYLLQD